MHLLPFCSGCAPLGDPQSARRSRPLVRGAEVPDLLLILRQAPFSALGLTWRNPRTEPNAACSVEAFSDKSCSPHADIHQSIPNRTIFARRAGPCSAWTWQLKSSVSSAYSQTQQ